jgi:hypothetical protein
MILRSLKINGVFVLKLITTEQTPNHSGTLPPGQTEGNGLGINQQFLGVVGTLENERGQHEGLPFAKNRSEVRNATQEL